MMNSNLIQLSHRMKLTQIHITETQLQIFNRFSNAILRSRIIRKTIKPEEIIMSAVNHMSSILKINTGSYVRRRRSTIRNAHRNSYSTIRVHVLNSSNSLRGSTRNECHRHDECQTSDEKERDSAKPNWQGLKPRPEFV